MYNMVVQKTLSFNLWKKSEKKCVTIHTKAIEQFFVVLVILLNRAVDETLACTGCSLRKSSIICLRINWLRPPSVLSI